MYDGKYRDTYMVYLLNMDCDYRETFSILLYRTMSNIGADDDIGYVVGAERFHIFDQKTPFEYKTAEKKLKYHVKTTRARNRILLQYR